MHKIIQFRMDMCWMLRQKAKERQKSLQLNVAINEFPPEDNTSLFSDLLVQKVLCTDNDQDNDQKAFCGG